MQVFDADSVVHVRLIVGDETAVDKEPSSLMIHGVLHCIPVQMDPLCCLCLSIAKNECGYSNCDESE